MIYAVNDKLTEYITRTRNIITSTDKNIFDLETMIGLLQHNGYKVKNLKPSMPNRGKSDSITLRISESGIPTQTLKIHPDTFDMAIAMYEDAEQLNTLASLNLVAQVNWTAPVYNPHHENKIRVVFYNYLDGPTLVKLSDAKYKALFDAWEKKIEQVGVGYWSWANKSDFVLINGNPILTDFNKIRKGIPSSLYE